MKILKNLSICLGIALMSTPISCKKYEDGPLLSLRSKKERVANTWKIFAAYEDGQDVSDNYDQYEIEFDISGDARLEATYTFSNVTYSTETDGTWEFNNDKENISIDMEDDSADETYQILKLKEDELWLRELGGEVELHFEPK